MNLIFYNLKQFISKLVALECTFEYIFWKYELESIFEYIFSIMNHLFVKLGKLIESWNIFLGKTLQLLEDWVLDPSHFESYELTAINQKPIMMSLSFVFFRGYALGSSKIGNIIN